MWPALRKRMNLVVLLLILFRRFWRQTLSKRFFECSAKRSRTRRLLRHQRFAIDFDNNPGMGCGKYALI